jgi:transposase
MRQKSNSTPGVVRDARPQHPAGNPEARCGRREDPDCARWPARRDINRRALPAQRHRREHVLLLVEGGGPLLHVSRRIFPFIERVFADSGYTGEKVATATLIAVEIVRKNPDQVGFAVNPRRWVIELFFAWIGRNRRLAKDFEATIDSARAFLYAASVMLLVRRIAPLHDFRNRL